MLWLGGEPFFSPVTLEGLNGVTGLQGDLGTCLLNFLWAGNFQQGGEVKCLGGVAAVVIAGTRDGLFQGVEHIGINPERFVSCMDGKMCGPDIVLARGLGMRVVPELVDVVLHVTLRLALLGVVDVNGPDGHRGIRLDGEAGQAGLGFESQGAGRGSWPFEAARWNLPRVRNK